jgi:chemotaxis protein CheZ
MIEEPSVATQRKIFRIEQLEHDQQPLSVAPQEAESALRHVEVMTALNALRALLEPGNAPAPQAEIYTSEIVEAKKLKAELDIIDEAIKRTRHELVSLRDGAFEGPTVTRAANELDAVVDGTEMATGHILAAAEDIEQLANTLGAGLKNDHERGMAQDIQDRVTRIFEACNFQDLAGQRIDKVVTTLKFVEAHIARMMEIWDKIERAKEHAPQVATTVKTDKFLNGPMLDGDDGHSSQNDIDALFY